MQKRRLGCLVLAVLHFSESGMVRAAWVQCRAFPHELQPEPISRACRVIPLQICGVLAPKAYRESGKCGWYRGRNAFRPDYVG